MKKILYAMTVAVLCMAAGCQEWEPVIGNQGEPSDAATVTMTPNMTIAQVKELYKGTPYHFEKDIVIGGKIISSDISGNVYRSLYIQDETGAIEVKIGSTGLYNDYKLGQMLYVKCEGLTLGNYGGMLQIGYEDPTGEYETAYIDVKRIIDSHIFKGAKGTPVAPEELSEDVVAAAVKGGYKSPVFGKYVTLKGLTYANEIFVLVYLDSNANKKASGRARDIADVMKLYIGDADLLKKRLKNKFGIVDNTSEIEKNNQIATTIADVRLKEIANCICKEVNNKIKKIAFNKVIISGGVSKYKNTKQIFEEQFSAPVENISKKVVLENRFFKGKIDEDKITSSNLSLFGAISFYLSNQEIYKNAKHGFIFSIGSKISCFLRDLLY